MVSCALNHDTVTQNSHHVPQSYSRVWMKDIFFSDWRSSRQQDPIVYANVYATNIILHYAERKSSEFLAILYLNLASSSSRSLSGKKLVSTSGFLPVTTN